MALPSGYTELAYLESTGTQYIDVGTVSRLAYTIEIDAEILSSPSPSHFLYGVWLSDFEYTVGIDTANNSLCNQLRINCGTGLTPVSATGAYTSGRHTWRTAWTEDVYDIVSLYVDNVKIGDATRNGQVSGVGTHSYLFAAHYVSGSTDTDVGNGSARIYSAKVVNANNNNSVVRNFVPAMRNSDSVLGMYDTTHDVFYTNAGTGEFRAPGIAPPSSLTVPSGLTVGTAFPIAWGASPDASVTGYILERSVDGGAFESIYSGTGYYYSDTPVAGWTSVQYRVCATDGEDNSGYVTSAVRSVVDPSAPVSQNSAEQYTSYLAGLEKPFKKVVRLEFLQPDDTVAFALGGAGQKIPIQGRDSRTFLQSGSLSVSLQNGQRRKATVVLGNRDGAFDYAVNKLWFGQRVRLLMGMRLPSGEDFYLPQGVFYIENPSALYSPNEKTMTLNLADKWAYLDGSLFGNLEAAYSVSSGTNIFSAMNSVLNLSKYTYTAASADADKIDPAKAVYTTYYNGRTYSASHSDGSISSNIAMTDTPYEITENRGSTFGALLLKLNEMLAGWIGYDATGALRVEPSQDDIDDADKPVLFAFTPENSILLSRSETSQNTGVYNDVTVAGEGLTNAAVWARAVNDDPSSDTNVKIIGRRVYVEEKADYWNTDQCASLARWILKRKTVLQKSVTIECGQMFHLIENRLVSVKRTDKAGEPIEKHLIQGFTIPVGETGSMSISCTSVNDLPDFTVTTSVS